MTFECSYAGVGLPVPTDEGRQEVERLLTTLDLRDIQPPPRWPGKNLTGLAWNDPVKERPFRLGQLFWPCGASRWACGRFLASHYQVNQILGVVQPSGGTPPTPQPLVLQAESAGVVGKVTAAIMYMLPPRPIGGLLEKPLAAFVGTPPVTGPADLYLLTLVDVRYFWQWAQASAGAGTTDTPEDWAALIDTTLSNALNGVALDPGTIDTAYGSVEPDSAFWTSYENAALMLDAALANTGRVLAANYDGTFVIQKIADARTAVKTERDKWKATRHSGGPVLNLDAATTDNLRNLILPEKVTVTFPQWVDDTGYYKPAPNYRGWALDSYGGVKTYEVTTTTLTGFSGAAPMAGWVKVFHDTAKARYPDTTAVTDDDPPDNDTDLQTLATKVAQDYADSLKARLDEIYPGIVPWAPDGVNDLTFLYTADSCCTRVQGPPLNAGVTELQHSLGPLEVPAPTASPFKHYLITGQFVKDDPGLVASPSGYCFYPAVELLGPAGPLVDPTTGEAVWVIFRYTDPVVENTGAPFTVVGVDGTKVHLARKLGWSYAPDDFKTPTPTPHAGESRPVCYSHETAYAIAVDCSTDTPKAVTEG